MREQSEGYDKAKPLFNQEYYSPHIVARDMVQEITKGEKIDRKYKGHLGVVQSHGKMSDNPSK